MNLLRFLAHFLGRYIPWLVLAVAAAAGFALLTGMLVALIEPMFEEVLLASRSDLEVATAADPGLGQLVPDRPEEGLRARIKEFFTWGYEELKVLLGITDQSVVVFLPVLLVVVFLVRALMAFVSGYSFQRVGLGATTDIRNELYRSVLTQSSSFHARHTSGEILSRIVNDVTMMQNAVSQRAVDLVQMSMTLVVLVVLLVANNPRLALICLVLLPLVLFPIVRFGQGMRRTSHKSQERMADLASLVAEGVRGHRVVKAFGMEDFEYRRFEKATQRHLRVNLWATVLDNLSSPVIETLGVVGIASLLVYAGLEIRSGSMSAPAFLSFLFTLVFMYDPIRRLNKVNLVLQQALAAARRVSDLIATPNDIKQRPGARVIDGLRRGVTFEKVSFGYGDANVLHDLDLDLAKGQTVALVGSSGAGKSTVVNLLLRFFDPDEGAIRIDGVDIRDLTLESLRALTGIVTQETVLFNDTVCNNIAYGRADTPFDRIRDAASAAYADDFIRDLEDGYDTIIGEGGLTLSGGQRQRLAIARALLKDAPLLVLDEATSNLDAESEALVQKALSNLMLGRTSLVIAHRISTVMRADRIVVLENGRIVEQGHHAELLSVGGVYKRLYDLQFRV